MSHERDVTLWGETVHTLFQPIVHGATLEAHGFEALTRGPPGSALNSPAALFAAATAQGTLLDLERACLASALRGFSALEIEGKLFLNVLPQTLLQWSGLAPWLDDQLHRYELDPHILVIELTEHGTQQEAELASRVAPLRALRCDI